MTNFEEAIVKLLRRIERAESKGKTKKVTRLNEQLNSVLNWQKKHEQEMQDILDHIFYYDNEQNKDNKSEDSEDSEESDEELPSNLGTVGSSEEVSNGADSSNNLHENPVLESQEREDIDVNEEEEE